MHRFPARLVMVATTMLLATLGACSGEDSTVSEAMPSDSPSSPGASDGGTSDGGSATPDSSLPGFCDVVTPEAVGAVIGEDDLQAKQMPHDTCTFEPGDARSTYVSISALPDDATTGGLEGHRSSSLMVFDDPVISDPGVGDQSFLATGSIAGGSGQSLQAVALADGVIVVVSISPEQGVDAATLESWGSQLLQLAVSAL